MTIPSDLIAEVRGLLDRDALELPETWSCLCVFLLRQAIELTLDHVLADHISASSRVSARAQLIVLSAFASDTTIAREAAHTWYALSAAAHLRGTGTTPSRAEIEMWFRRVEELVDDFSHLKV